MKILFGGTFDPIHNGHILLGLHVSHKFNHQVELLPLGGVPNYKALPEAPLTDRLVMLELIISEYPNHFAINYSEARNSIYSPTCQTLRHLRKVYGQELPLYFIIGGDSFLSLDSWDNWEELFSLTNFIVAARPDYPLNSMRNTLQSQVLPRVIEHTSFKPVAAGQIILIDFEPVAISSTQIRRLSKTGQSITGLVAPVIASYINNHNLYKGN